MNGEISTLTTTFTRRLPSGRHGARLARRLALSRLAEWGVPGDGESADAVASVASVVAELAANAVTHGRVPGRDFELRLGWDPGAGVVRIEVSDACGERRPVLARVRPGDEAESGRGLLLVQALARAWGVSSREVGKTVWAEVALDEGPQGARP
ncbi:ATP-binding protein [Streptomyces sp. NBC_00448]|uniref:ATP-binding protein n=1 Tax=Streptomyces sp. NBC_00448 TaxID=2903652 RepID=UPI002E1AD8F1